MKKNLLSKLLFLTASAVAVACSNSLDATQDNDCAQVSFNVSCDGTLRTGSPKKISARGPRKALSDGSLTSKLVCEVYDEKGEIVTIDGASQKVESNVTDLKTGHNLTLTLPKGKELRVVFWAQNGASTAYNTENLKNVTVDYSNALNNDEGRDAFCGSVTVNTGETAAQSVKLKRPFAQVNMGVTAENFANYEKSVGKILQSKMVIGKVGTAYNVLDGTSSGSEEATFDFADIPAETELLKVTKDGTEASYRYVSTCYVLPPASANTTTSSLLDKLVFTFRTADATKDKVVDLSAANAPVRTNFRTNIINVNLEGQSTGDFTFDITLDTQMDGTYNGSEQESAEVTDKSAFKVLYGTYSSKSGDDGNRYAAMFDGATDWKGWLSHTLDGCDNAPGWGNPWCVIDLGATYDIAGLGMYTLKDNRPSKVVFYGCDVNPMDGMTLEDGYFNKLEQYDGSMNSDDYVSLMSTITSHDNTLTWKPIGTVDLSGWTDADGSEKWNWLQVTSGTAKYRYVKMVLEGRSGWQDRTTVKEFGLKIYK
ncbi:MAG: hypothetical protein PUG09_03560 [Prevotella sp.]|nr:hypothetical protein [Prevotella sp.]